MCVRVESDLFSIDGMLDDWPGINRGTKIGGRSRDRAFVIRCAYDETKLYISVNLRDDRVGYKIREASLRKLPYAIVVGERERSAGNINVRSRDRGELGEMEIAAFLDSIAEDNAPAALVVQ